MIWWLAILFQIKTDVGNKYVYLPNDIENNGYNPFGEYDETYNTIIHGYTTTYFVKYTMDDGIPKFIIKKTSLLKDKNIKIR